MPCMCQLNAGKHKEASNITPLEILAEYVHQESPRIQEYKVTSYPHVRYNRLN